MNYDLDIILLSESLQDGYTIREVCPACEGGSTHEMSLAITRLEGELVWQCFRARCGITGCSGRSSTAQAVQVKKPRRVWEGTTYPLPPKVSEAIFERWGIADPPHWYWTTDYGGRVAMSIRSPHDTHRGWVLRTLSQGVSTKALTYVNENEEGISWYKTHPHVGTVVVEDIPSAVRASLYANSVALLGTGISDRRAMEIQSHAPLPIIMALDQDAIDLSFKWARKYSLLWGDVKVLPLARDIKDMQEQELKELLNERTTSTIECDALTGGI